MRMWRRRSNDSSNSGCCNTAEDKQRKRQQHKEGREHEQHGEHRQGPSEPRNVRPQSSKEKLLSLIAACTRLPLSLCPVRTPPLPAAVLHAPHP
eukprot:139660-Rhodomonas_salina.1